MREAAATDQTTVSMSILGDDIPNALYWWLRCVFIERPEARVRFERVEVAHLKVYVEEVYELGGINRVFELVADIDLSAFINDGQCKLMARMIYRDYMDTMRREERQIRKRFIRCGCGFNERDPRHLCPKCGRSTH